MKVFWTVLILLLVISAGIWGYRQYQVHYEDENGGPVKWLNGKPTPAEKNAFDVKDSGGPDTELTPPAETADQTGLVGSPSGGSAAPAAYSPAAPVPAAQTAVPRGDSQPPNAPDGVRFGGSGVYELYRQGNLTYRMDTATGRTCVAFATLEEWRKPLVRKNGCDSRS